MLFAQRPDGAQTPTQQEQFNSRTSIPVILEQIYSAFALEEEEKIYDALANAVSGDLINKLYLERRAAQVADHAEDDEAAILGVEVFEITPLGRANSFTVSWRVIGRITHTSHIHERINLYTADLSVGEIDGSWKLTDFALKENTRADDLMFVGGE